MKKTLLIVAAALAAGMISVQAQNVYSQNVVGYVNQTIPPFSYQIIGSQFINGSDVGQTNGDINATLINGLISSPNDPPNLSSNSQIYAWNGSSYTVYYFFNHADATTWEGFASPAGWYDGGGTPASVNLNSGKAAFIYNHSASPMTVSSAGQVFQGSNIVNVINTGYNLINLLAPVSTNLVVDASGNAIPFGLPLSMTSSPVDPPTQSANDTLFYWNGSSFTVYYYFNQADATTWEGFASPAGFYDGGGTPMPVKPAVNQGFFLFHNGAPINWTNTFIVQ